MSDYNDPTEARRELIATAGTLRKALYNLNVYAAALNLDGVLASQCDNAAYGEIYDGFKILVRELYPDDGIQDRADQIIDTMFEGDIDDTTVEVAAQHVADHHAPLSGYTTDDVRDDLLRYQAYQRALSDGVLDIAKIIGEPGDRDEATAFLDERIAECRAALTYRGEPETKPNDRLQEKAPSA